MAEQQADLPQDIQDLILHMRLIGGDTQECEVKEAVKKLPESLCDSISAFANRNGGVIILGLSESRGFTAAEGFEADKIHDAMLSVGDRMTPVIRPDVEMYRFEGASIVVARIFAISRMEAPCFITAKGPYQGSFVRTGDGDRKLTRYEVDRLMEGRRQPRFDLEPVLEASMDDLNSEILDAIVARNREISPRNLGKLRREEILTRLGVIVKVESQLHPTLAGLLVAGVYPQQFFPRLNITFTIYPGVEKVQMGQRLRYVDTRSINGPISDMLFEAKAFLSENMRTGALIEGALRQDVPDYPLTAFREAVINALQHRDYSPQGRGSQVQINLYADRLEILNPGGLYGSASVETIDAGVSSTRNVNLSRLLETTPYESSEEGKGYVIENRGTGLDLIRKELKFALMPPPVIRDYISAFSITFGKRRLTEEERSGRNWEAFDQVLLQELLKRGSLSATEIMEMSGAARTKVYSHIKKLMEENKIEPTEPVRSPKQRYRIRR